MSFLVVILACLAAISTAATPQQQIEAVNELIDRVWGSGSSHRFSLSVVNEQSCGQKPTATGPAIPLGGYYTISNGDGYTGGVNGTVDVIKLSGCDGVSLAAAFGYYLKQFCGNSWSWGWNGSANSFLAPVGRLPAVPAGGVARRTFVPIRYYQNVCTVSYSMAFWDTARWLQEVDWMAMSGVNFPLAFTGQEFVWAKLWSSLGLTEAEMDAFFGGPAFLAWSRMGNIQGWGGPLGPSWRAERYRLQVTLLQRMRTFGMTPILPGFAGFVPSAIPHRLYPNASVVRSHDWNGFGTVYGDTYLLEPTDPLFLTIGRRFLELQNATYGTDHVYNADTFNEMTPSSGDLGFLKSTSAAVYAPMKAFSPQSVWVMQGWLFLETFWTPERMQAYLSGTPVDATIILDLDANDRPQWRKLMSDGPRMYIWNMLHNYGGRRALYGNLPAVGTDPRTAYSQSTKAGKQWMVGVGITPESIEQNPVVYQFFLDSAWGDAPLDIPDWISNYVATRYGVSSTSSLVTTFMSLYNLVYTGHGAYMFLPNFAIVPSLTGVHIGYDSAALWDVLKGFTDASKTVSKYALGAYRYDVVDVARQCLANLFSDAVTILGHAVSQCGGSSYETLRNISFASTPLVSLRGLYHSALLERCNRNASCGGFDSQGNLYGWSAAVATAASSQGIVSYLRRWESVPSCQPAVDAAAGVVKDLLSDFDAVLSTDVNFMLGPWITHARAIAGSNNTLADLYEFNARNQITLWGPNGEIDDYASKQWSGLASSYHALRWDVLLTMVAKASTTRPNFGPAYHGQLISIGKKWCATTAATQKFPDSPVAGTPLPEEAAALVLNSWGLFETAGHYRVAAHGRSFDGATGAVKLQSSGRGNLAHLCDRNPSCVGFSSDGFISMTGDTVPSSSSVLVYLKV